MAARKHSMPEILGITAILSAVSLVFQMVIADCFVMMTGDDFAWQSITLAVYLAAVGLGTYVCARLKAADPWRRLFTVEIWLLATGACAAFGILSVEMAYRLVFSMHASALSQSGQHSLAPLILTLMLCQGFAFLVGFLSGFEIPLTLRLAADAAGSDEGPIRRILGMNYLGALAGSLAFSFLLLPYAGVFHSAIAAAALSWGVCAYALARGHVPRNVARLSQLALAAAVVAGMGRLSTSFYRFYAAHYYLSELGIPQSRLNPRRAVNAVLAAEPYVSRIRSRYQYLDLVTDPRAPTPLERYYDRRAASDPKLPLGLELFLNRRHQFRGAGEVFYHEHLAHVPVQLFRHVPGNVLILGGGDGLLARELLKYPEVRSITDVELDPAMIRLAENDPRFLALNNGSFLNSRTHVVMDDAFTYVRNERRKFDAVYMDFPYYFANYDLSRLASVEFYRNVRARLDAGGFVAINFTLDYCEDLMFCGGWLSDYPDFNKSNTILFNTLEAAGYRTIFPYDDASPELVPMNQAKGLAQGDSAAPPGIPLLADQARWSPEWLEAEFPDSPLLSRNIPLAEIGNGFAYQAMVVFAPERRDLNFDFRDYGIRLFALNAARLKLLRRRSQGFSHVEDRRYVNSIFRPRLMSILHLREPAFR